MTSIYGFYTTFPFILNNFFYNETGSRSACIRPRSDPPKMKNSTPNKIVAKKKNK